MATEERLIDAEPIKKFIVDGLNNPNLKEAFGHDAIEILAEIEYAPTVDAVEVVRCEKCVHSLCDGWICGGPSFTMPSHPTYPDAFCSYGDKVGGDGNA